MLQISSGVSKFAMLVVPRITRSMVWAPPLYDWSQKARSAADPRGRDSRPGPSLDGSAQIADLRRGPGSRGLPVSDYDRSMPSLETDLSADERRELLKEVYARGKVCTRCPELAATRKTVVFGAGNADDIGQMLAPRARPARCAARWNLRYLRNRMRPLTGKSAREWDFPKPLSRWLPCASVPA